MTSKIKRSLAVYTIKPLLPNKQFSSSNDGSFIYDDDIYKR